MKVAKRSFVSIALFAGIIVIAFLMRNIFTSDAGFLRDSSRSKSTSNGGDTEGIQATPFGTPTAHSEIDARENNANLLRKNYAISSSIRSEFPGLTSQELVNAVRKKIAAAQDIEAKKIAAINEKNSYAETYKALLPAANAGDVNAMSELASLLQACGGLIANAAAYPEIKSKYIQQFMQCDSVTSNGYADSLRWLALAARDGSLSARAGLLSLGYSDSRYRNAQTNDPAWNGLLQQEVLNSLHYFSELQDKTYIETGWTTYSSGIVPKNDEYAAAYRIAGHSLRAWQFPNATSTADNGYDVAIIFSSLSASQQSAAIARSEAILARCCLGVPSVRNFTKYRKP